MSKLHNAFNFVPALTSLVLATALLSVACDGDDGDVLESRAAQLDEQLDAEPPSSVDLSDRPLAEQLAQLQPQKTRAGWLRYTDPAINNPAAAPILLERLIAGNEDPEVRVALAEAIGRTGADYAAAVSTALAGESDARVREMLIHTLGRRAPTPDAHPGLTLGLHDTAPEVRAAAVRTIGTRSDAAVFSDALIQALADNDADVRRDAARSLGVLGNAAALAPLGALLTDANADVRLHSLRAIDRIDPATSQASLATLEQDTDPRIQRLVATIRTR